MAAIFPAVGAAVSGLFAGGGAAAAGAAAATTATTAASGVLTLSKVLSAGSALAAIGQGFMANAQAKTQAAFAEAEADQELAAGAVKARDLSKEYAELRSEQEVIQLANGLDLGTGTPGNVGQATQKVADRNLEITRKNASYRASSARLRARGLMQEGRAALFGGFQRAASIGLDSYQLTG
jgi:hypothetical protein